MLQNKRVLDLMRADYELAQDSRELGLEGWLKHFDENACSLDVGMIMVRGRNALRALYQKAGFDPQRLRWRLDKAVLDKTGKKGYTAGVIEVYPQKAGVGKPTLVGKYFSLWKKQPDGSWKVAADMGVA